MNFPKILFFLVAAVAAWQIKGAVLRAHSAIQADEKASQADIADHGLQGSYIMREDTGNARLTLNFLDKHRVQILGDGKPWGKNNGMCTYTVNGTTIDLTHACGVFHLAIQGNVLEDAKYGWHYQLSP